LIISVKEIQGKCLVHNVGEKIVIQSPQIVPKQTDALRIHALGSMLSMPVPLSRGISFKELRLAHEEGNIGYVQCLDLDQSCTPARVDAHMVS
jgi:hypothetical protein